MSKTGYGKTFQKGEIIYLKKSVLNFSVTTPKHLGKLVIYIYIIYNYIYINYLQSLEGHQTTNTIVKQH